MKIYDRPPHTGTLVDDLLAKVDQTLEDGAEKLRRAHETTARESGTDAGVPNLPRS